MLIREADGCRAVGLGAVGLCRSHLGRLLLWDHRESDGIFSFDDLVRGLMVRRVAISWGYAIF